MRIHWDRGIWGVETLGDGDLKSGDLGDRDPRGQGSSGTVGDRPLGTRILKDSWGHRPLRRRVLMDRDSLGHRSLGRGSWGKEML